MVRFYRGKYKYKTRRKYRKRYSKKGSVAKNTKAIAKLTHNQYKSLQYKQDYNSDDVASTNGYQIIALINPPAWGPIFQSNVADGEGDRFFIQRLILRSQMTVTNSIIVPAVPELTPQETGPISFCLMVVSLKKEHAVETLHRTAQLTNLHEGGDYHRTVVGNTIGDVFWKMNPALYNVHHSYRSTVGNFATYGTSQEQELPTYEPANAMITNIGDAIKRRTFNIPWRRQIKRGVGMFENQSQKHWKTLGPTAIEPHDRLYLIIWSAADGLQELAGAFQTMIYGKIPV